jgi:CubicO group peptidase (beta-lactamase class C family)
MKTQTPVTVDSIFCTASVSKCFVATAIMQLAERGQINLDAPLVQYLPYFQMDDERHRQILIRQILSHTSGMPDMADDEYDEFLSHPEWDDGAAERYTRSLVDKKLIANPGERFSYSNIAYNVLGDVIAKVSGKSFGSLGISVIVLPAVALLGGGSATAARTGGASRRFPESQSFEAYMQEQILLPAGMPNSTFLLADVPSDRLAVPHLRSPEMKVNPVYPYHRADAPASFLHATVLDMCRWGVTNLQRSLLPPASYDLMWTPVAEWGYPRPSMYEEIGLGWTLGHYKDVRTVSHGGMGFGWTDFLLILPEKGYAAVVLSNEESFARTRTIRAVADAILGKVPQANAVSWMVPISQSLAKGGIQSAYARYAILKAGGTDEFYFDEDDLLNLSLQLVSAGNLEQAIEVLGLNILAFPECVESYLEQAKLYFKKGETAPVRELLLKVLSINPDTTAATELLEKVHHPTK